MKLLTAFLLVGATLVRFTPAQAEDKKPYFPPATGTWETVKPADAGVDAEKLQKALDYAGKNQSSGVVILWRGRILAEQYWKVQGARSAKYRQRVIGRDKAGRAIEDVASCQKSVAAILVGIAREKGLLKIGDRVDKYLGAGWSKATAEQEQAITIRHLITMTSGLTDRGTFEAAAGTKWRYNTWAYAKSMTVVEKAAKMDRHTLTAKWLTGPVGMADSKWVKRGSPLVQAVNAYGFATTARDLARFGLLVSAKGRWGTKAILKDQKYLQQATRSSQKLNPFYGYLWWVNRNAFAARRIRRLPTAPFDMFSANGALNRRCFIVPGRQLVITRLGDRPDDNRRFDREFWRLLREAARKKTNQN